MKSASQSVVIDNLRLQVKYVRNWLFACIADGNLQYEHEARVKIASVGLWVSGFLRIGDVSYWMQYPYLRQEKTPRLSEP